jgi:adenylate cyclase class 2
VTYVEREIKLRFESPDVARAALIQVGATPLRDRRLQDDRVYDWPDGRLTNARCLLRVRRDGDTTKLTFKGPPQVASMKVREEVEITVDNGERLVTLLNRLGLTVRFRYQKFREEFERPGVVLAIDETPVGTFAELEGDEHGVTATAAALGRKPSDYILDSYRGLFLKERQARGLDTRHMLFETPSGNPS